MGDVSAIDALLPQTQCTRCGYPSCRDYAAAIASGGARINQCPPGGTETIVALAKLTGLPVEPLGTVGGDVLRIQLVGAGATSASEERGGTIADPLEVPLEALRHAWDSGLARALGWQE